MTFGYGLGHLALNLTAMESSMEKYTKMLGFPSLEVLKAEYSTEASSNWEKVARSVAQSESVASGGQRPGIGSSAWTRNPAAIAPAYRSAVSLGSGARSHGNLVCSCCMRFEIIWGVLLGDVRDLGVDQRHQRPMNPMRCRWPSWISISWLFNM